MMKNVLMLEFLNWNNPIRVGSHHYASMMEKDGLKVTWLTNPFSPLHFIKSSNIEDLKYRFYLWKNNGKNITDRIFEYSPFTILPYTDFPILRSKFVMNNSLNFTFPFLPKFLTNKVSSKFDIVWITNPIFFPIMSKIKYDVSIFRMADDITAFKGIPNNFKELQKSLIEEVDILIVTSKPLYDKYASIKKNTFYIPNGVDVEHFLDNSYDFPIEYNRNRKRVVYVGAIEEWFDIDLVKYCASKLKEIDFYIIGNPKIDISNVKDISNLFFLGPKPYKDIPGYLQNANVGIIPFKVNKLIKAVNPIKYYEYCASRIPTVSTSWEELKKNNYPIFLSRNFDEFVRNIIKAIQIGEKEEYKQKLLNFAKNHSWQSKYMEIKKIIGLKN